MDTDSLKGERFSCSCGCKNFHQETFTRAFERVELVKQGNEIVIGSLSLEPIKEDDIEYKWEYVCVECGATYAIYRDSNGHKKITDAYM